MHVIRECRNFSKIAIVRIECMCVACVLVVAYICVVCVCVVMR